VVTSLTRYTLRTAAVHDPDPARVLGHLNTVMNHENHGEDPRFCTVIFGLLTPDDGGFAVTLASGGHPPALLLRADGTVEYLPTPGGELVGVLPDAHIATISLRLAPRDTLLLYTDGLTEARIDAAGGRYGDDALLEFVTGLGPATAHEAGAALSKLLDTFGDGLDDDAAILAIGVPALG
jgi:phosphoserine phosphatase RsbU/P